MSTLLLKLLRRAEALASAQRVRFARWSGVVAGSDCTIEKGAQISLRSTISRRGALTLGRGCQISNGALLHPYDGHITLGENVFIGPYAVLYGHGGVMIGDDVLISMHCRLLSSNHTVPVAGKRIRWEPDILLPTRLGRDVWLGAGVTILGGVTIGDGCVVGAGAVVTRDLPPHSIAMGVPAKSVGQRQSATKFPFPRVTS